MKHALFFTFFATMLMLGSAANAIDYNSKEFKLLYEQSTGKKYGGGAGVMPSAVPTPPAGGGSMYKPYTGGNTSNTYGGGGQYVPYDADKYDASKIKERMIQEGNLDIDKMDRLDNRAPVQSGGYVDPSGCVLGFCDADPDTAKDKGFLDAWHGRQ